MGSNSCCPQKNNAPLEKQCNDYKCTIELKRLNN